MIHSETETCRESLAKFCVGPTGGLDIGFGGARPIVDNAICIDRAPGDPRRANFGEDMWPTHLVLDAFGPLPFVDGSLDFCFSSHCLEDGVETAAILCEWTRVLKPGGNLVLFLPDQKLYEGYCALMNTLPNQAHVHPLMSLGFIKERLPLNVEVIYEHDAPTPTNPYSFELCARRIAVKERDNPDAMD